MGHIMSLLETNRHHLNNIMHLAVGDHKPVVRPKDELCVGDECRQLRIQRFRGDKDDMWDVAFWAFYLDQFFNAVFAPVNFFVVPVYAILFLTADKAKPWTGINLSEMSFFD